jgi:hypothetical protein
MNRRLAVACCQTVSERFVFDDTREALLTIERFAEGRASFDELVAARTAARESARRMRKRGSKEYEAAMAVCHAAGNQSWAAAYYAASSAAKAGLQAESLEQSCRELNRKFPRSA